MTTSLTSAIRAEVARRAHHRCSYCQSQEDVVGAQFTVDHIIPQALGGSDELDNLCLACWDCNRTKQTHVTGMDPHTGQRVPLYDPGQQVWNEHFEWNEDATLIVGLTPAGRAPGLLRPQIPSFILGNATNIL